MTQLTVDEKAIVEELYKRRTAQNSLIEFCKFTLPGYSVGKHHLYIAKRLEEAVNGKNKRIILTLPPRAGKALGVDTPIPTPNGFRRIGDLRRGDVVFDEQGLPCNVVDTMTWIDRPVYRVEFKGGEHIIADAEHEWSVRLDRKYKHISIRTTEWLSNRKTDRAPRIEPAKPLVLPERDLPIDPYVLGVWLGDGHNRQATISQSDEDAVHIRAEFERRGYKTTDRNTYATFGVLDLLVKLRHLGLLRNKHIPSDYLFASKDQRLDLLRGLIDTDGYVGPKGGIEFCSVYRSLAYGVKALVASLGAKASVKESKSYLYGVEHQNRFRVSFYLKDAALLPRKQIYCRNGVKFNGYFMRVIPAGRDTTCCIQVDSPSSLYLCGYGMVPTHNSEIASRRLPAWFMGKQPSKHIICATYNDEFAQDFGRDVRAIVQSPEFSLIFPNVRLSSDSKAANRWATNFGGIYVSAGVGGALTGRGAHLAIIDDPIKNAEDAESKLFRDRIWTWYRSVLYTRLQPGASICLLQTRWHDDDLAGRLIREAKLDGEAWEIVNLPAIAMENDPLGRQPGEALWPEWFPIEVLNQQRKTVGPRVWSALFQQNPIEEEGIYFKKQWIEDDQLRYDRRMLIDSWKKGTLNLHIYGASDFAVTGSGGDYTVHIVAGVDSEDNLYILDMWRKQGTSDEWVEAQIDLMDEWKPLIWGEENGQIKGSVGPFLEKRMNTRRIYCNRQGYTSNNDKPTRARSIQARMAMGKVRWPRTGQVDWMEHVISEMSRFPAGVHDDIVDAMSLLGRMLSEMTSAPEYKGPKSTAIRHTTQKEMWEAHRRARKRGGVMREAPVVKTAPAIIFPDDP